MATTTAAPGTASTETPAPGPGVFSSRMLREAIEAGRISPKRIPAAHIQPASIDLRLGAKAYRLRSSFLPGASARVRDRLPELQMGAPLDLADPEGVVLEPGRPYLVRLMESVRLPEDATGRTNPRSSTGRLDVFTRVISDHGTQFDEIEPGYEGPLWLEVYSNTFTVNARQGLALTQLRISSGDSWLDAAAIRELHARDGLVFAHGGSSGSTPRERIEAPPIGQRGLLLSVDLPGGEFCGWRAKRNSALLDLAKTAAYDPFDYWEPVFAEPAGRLVIQPDDFHLLISKEFVSIPPDVAAEMIAYDPTNGELRTHYAGFCDPGFGYGTELHGTQAVFEVRAHDVPFMLEDGQPIARLGFERMAEAPSVLYGSSELGSHFQRQGVNLSRQFKAPEASIRFQMTSWR